MIRGAVELRIPTEGPKLQIAKRFVFAVHPRLRLECFGFLRQIFDRGAPTA